MKIENKIKTVKTHRGRVAGYTAHYQSIGTAATRPTKDEALSDLSALVAFRCSDRSTFVNVIPARGHVAVISFDIYGVVFLQHAWPDGHVSASGGYKDFGDAEDTFRFSVAQLTWDGTLAEPDILPNDKQREFKTWAEFQLRYRYAVAELANDQTAAYAYACNPLNPHMPEAFAS